MPAGLLLLSGGAAMAQDLGPLATTPDNARRYTECMALARREPLRALPMAEKWMGEGGGLGARHCVASAMYEAGRPAQAAAQFETIARDLGQDRPDLRADLLAQAGQAWSDAGDVEKAAAAQSRALDLKPGDVELWVDRGLSFATMGQWTRAVSDFDRALALRRDNVEVLVLRAAAWRNAGDAGHAMADAQLALRIAPDNTQALLERGFTFLAQGNQVAARADFTKVLSLVPPGSSAAKRAAVGLKGDTAAPSAAPGNPPKSGDKR
ncbi:MAG: tetratricopeptide repeat protein [Alphaproteobacteria bacterium]|nr:tetratricopeptide repeat protein [Alphaproteobacteria bacterium]